jgi:sugar/nucleoside kinase (ribokinase family)
MRIAFVGHVCIDKNEIRGEIETFYGGGVIHGAITAKRLGAQVSVLTKCAPADKGQWTSFREAEIEAVFLPSRLSTSIKNAYPSANPDDRQSSLLSSADPFTASHLEMIESDVVHLNPLWFGEFPLALLPRLKRRATMLAGDAQGFLRHATEGGKLVNRDLAEKQHVLPLFDVFKVDSREAHILTGYDEIRQAARAVHDLGPKTVLLTHSGGVCVFDGQEFYESPFTSCTLEGRTGRGDTCTGAFLWAMHQMGLREATSIAAEVTSQKMQYRGPYRG